ncbi:hypothetical protein TRFO_32356 [Tritrichomonas foetus]|uniref:Glycosyl hydrolase family 13 catalytic domain-containing protein n=1 Tax=Tritrichomonas foetus TaxID=1144522 RepID=A0A1J4JPC0_9EUKA|nr:hypothetical protein TRFO_32356 [Tritrichomonas foetus]|eukprot:OHT00883.1 hypothetical protein TRFO_32356 [Tritrichomonas foetus]
MSFIRAEPPFWWAGMKSPKLQILFRSETSLKAFEPIISSEDIKIVDVVHFDNPHYLALYLDLENAKPQIFNIELGSINIKYELKQRDPKSREIQGFDSSDVLYLIMPDRFARHTTKPSIVDEQSALSYDDDMKKFEEINKKAKEQKESKSDQNEPSEKSENSNKSEQSENNEGKNDQKSDDKNEENDQKSKEPKRTLNKPFIEIPDYPTFTDPITNTERVKYTFNRKDPNARHGGNIQGIIQHLDYIFDLGVTAIWLNPVLDNDMPHGSYHGYATTDYYNVDPRFGTNDDLLELINKIHQHGKKFVMDMIFNHCGSNHIWYKDPPCEDWFNLPKKGVITNHDITTTFSPYSSEKDWTNFNCGSFVSQMPDLNQKNKHLATYLTQNSIWWIEYSHINGIRQDTYPYCDPEYMKQWVNDVLEEYPNFNIVGEVWVESPVGVAYWQRGNPYSDNNLPTIMDFTFSHLSTEACSEDKDMNSGLAKIHNHLNYDFVYPDVFHILRFVENHDTNRFLREEPIDLGKFKTGFATLLTIPGIPQLYYGTEILMYGLKKRSDGYVRCDFPGGWIKDNINCFTEAGRTKLQNEAFNFMKTILHWRQGNEVISKGTMKHFRILNGIYVFQRKFNEKVAVVLISGTNDPAVYQAENYQEIWNDGHHLGTDIFSQKTIDISKDFVLQGHDVLILEMH